MAFKKKSDRQIGLSRSFKQSWFVQLDPSKVDPIEVALSFDSPQPPRLWSMLDFDSKTRFTLLWAKNHWVDVPDSFLQDLILAQDPSDRPVNIDFLEMAIPQASVARFSHAFLSGVKEKAQSGDSAALAEFIATQVHTHQTDKGAMPYIGHPKRVAQLVRGVPRFEQLSHDQKSDVVQAAWLHDVLEDSGENGFPIVLSSDLYAWGISKPAIYATENLSRKTPLTRYLEMESDSADYYKAINQNNLARMVKLADLADNCNLQRVRLMHSRGGSVDPNRYESALKAFKLSALEQEWFDSAIQKEVVYD